VLTKTEKYLIKQSKTNAERLGFERPEVLIKVRRSVSTLIETVV
jgi:hypothetical protein